MFWLIRHPICALILLRRTKSNLTEEQMEMFIAEFDSAKTEEEKEEIGTRFSKAVFPEQFA